MHKKDELIEIHMTSIHVPTLSYYSKCWNFSLFNHLWQSLYAPAALGWFLGLTRFCDFCAICWSQSSFSGHCF